MAQPQPLLCCFSLSSFSQEWFIDRHSIGTFLHLWKVVFAFWAYHIRREGVPGGCHCCILTLLDREVTIITETVNTMNDAFQTDTSYSLAGAGQPRDKSRVLSWLIWVTHSENARSGQTIQSRFRVLCQQSSTAGLFWFAAATLTATKKFHNQNAISWTCQLAQKITPNGFQQLRCR